MLNFLTENDKDIHHMIVNRNKYARVITQIPFNPDKKLKVVIR